MYAYVLVDVPPPSLTAEQKIKLEELAVEKQRIFRDVVALQQKSQVVAELRQSKICGQIFVAAGIVTVIAGIPAAICCTPLVGAGVAVGGYIAEIGGSYLASQAIQSLGQPSLAP